MTVTYTVKQEMIADNDTLIITDPCYIMRDEHWEHFLDLEFTKNPIGLDDYLRKYHNFGEVIAADTGIGDWSNEVYNIQSNETLGEFCADAGMVICCTASDLTNYGADMNEVNKLRAKGCLAIIPNYSGHINLCYESDEADTSQTPITVAVLEAVGDTEEDVNWSTKHLDEKN